MYIHMEPHTFVISDTEIQAVPSIIFYPLERTHKNAQNTYGPITQ